ncbi:MAG: NlpC/P60 family protein, partial [Actinomycetota bacterium]|nr:NlpC/P60 family protein [Actinomycetota bacterium]
TMMAWAQAGVGLPHSAAGQQGSGRPVSESQLKPGDLVFYYSPVHHVGMYIGNGMIVNAENPSAGIKVTGLHSMPYSGAVRPG